MTKHREKQYNPHIVAKKAGLALKLSPQQIVVKSILNMGNKNSLSTLLILVLAAIVLLATWLNADDKAEQLIGYLLGGFFLVLGLVASVWQFGNSLTITNTHLSFQRKLNRRRFPLGSNMEIIVRHKRINLNPDKGSLGKFFRRTHLVLAVNQKEQIILHFEMDDKQASEIHFLGKHLADVIEERIEKAQQE